jgi:hypothetical protein
MPIQDLQSPEQRMCRYACIGSVRPVSAARRNLQSTFDDRDSRNLAEIHEGNPCNGIDRPVLFHHTRCTRCDTPIDEPDGVRCRSAGFFTQSRTVDSGKCVRIESQAGLFIHFSHKSIVGMFTPIESAARKRPAALGRVGRCDPTNQYPTVSHGKGVGSQPGSRCHGHERTIAALLDDACETLFSICLAPIGVACCTVVPVLGRTGIG